MLDKKNYTPKELQERFGKVNGNDLFNKDATPDPASNAAAAAPVPETDAAAPVPEVDTVLPLHEFANKLEALRSFLQDLALPRMKETFELRAAAHKHGFPDCKTLDHFLHTYRTAPYGNDIRGLVFFLTQDLWGKACFLVIEKQVMDKVKLRYKNQLVDGTTPKTRRKSGTVKIMLVRMKQTYFIERFRHIGLEIHHEVVYKRHMKIHKCQGVVDIFKVTKASHGYDGFLGICVGHFSLLEKSVITPAGQSDIFQFLEEQAKNGSTMTASDILAVWSKADPAAVTVNTASSPTLSSLTATSSVSSPLYLCQSTRHITNSAFNLSTGGR